jgi:hypothetical protein
VLAAFARASAAALHGALALQRKFVFPFRKKQGFRLPIVVELRCMRTAKKISKAKTKTKPRATSKTAKAKPMAAAKAKAAAKSKKAAVKSKAKASPKSKARSGVKTKARSQVKTKTRPKVKASPKATARPTSRVRKPAPRRDGSGRLNPKYARDLRALSRENKGDDDDRAFFKTPRSGDDLAQELGEEAVETMTSGEAQGERLDEVVEEERGGPFVKTGGEEFAGGTDRSNPRDATREPFPRT